MKQLINRKATALDVITGWVFLVALLFLQACKQQPVLQESYLFETLDSSQTGLNFSNRLVPTDSFNMFTYMYFYNGAGIGAGDFNNDGLIDLFFASNQGRNKLYLNQGGLQFKDVTVAANIPDDHGWSTGVSVVDINNDGLLDIYICRVGHFETLRGHNQLLICKGLDANGTPTYEDEAATFGLAFSGFSTQAAFFDYDMDGDLDMFLMNHGIRSIGTFGERKSFLNTYDSLSGDRLYRNDGKGFTDVTRASAINSSSIGYGLGICVSDINLDGWPDIYIGNDFHENDYLYINQKNGTFKELCTDCTMHTSQFSMGVDVADINNDGLPEIASMDMLPGDPYILKRSLGEDEYNLFNMKLRYGYNPQYARNNLQLNLGNGHFSEIGRYAGIYATDWSWSSLWMDFDNDGQKDLFVSNGIPKRLNDMDYVNFISDSKMQEKIRKRSISNEDMKMVDQFPEIKIPNQFFHNKGTASFEDVAPRIKNDLPTFSNGAVYADLDNDGDLDIVVNNIADAALLYENKTSNTYKDGFIRLELKGPPANVHAIGAKLLLYTKQGLQTYEKYPARGFQSSMEIPLQAGLKNVVVDSAKLIWPDNSWQAILWQPNQTSLSVQYKQHLPVFDFSSLHRSTNASYPVKNITQASGILYKHDENNFVEFDREPLIPSMVSKEGPALAVADMNHDGLDDLFVGAARGSKPAIFIQQASGKFIKTYQPALDADSNYEDISACWADINNDGNVDLVVASGGNEYFGTDTMNTPRAYLNNGSNVFYKLSHAFDGLSLTASSVVANDFNGDSYVDLFISARAVPYQYGVIPRSYLLQNDGRGHFQDVTGAWNKELSHIGLVTNASWTDLDKDGKQDLLLTCEWGGIYAFMHKGKSFEKQTVTDRHGWWNFALTVDVDADGDLDIVAGNLGWNSRLRATAAQPVRLYYNDFDGNGVKEQLLTYYLQGREIPFANKGELDKQLPLLKKRFLYAENFAKATLQELVPPEKLKASEQLYADDFSNAVFINDGAGHFSFNALPWQAQLTCFKTACVVDANADHLPDILMMGNFYAGNIQMGSYDADYGTLLINKGKGAFEVVSLNGLQVKGETRQVAPIHILKEQAFVIARNNDSLKVIHFAKQQIQ